MLGEFEEEAGTEFANIITDAVFMGSDSDWARKLAEYKAEGLSDNDAIYRALKEDGLQILQAGLAGAVQGGAMGGISSAIR